MFQGNRLGFVGYRFLAKRVLHSYFGLEPVFSVSIFQVSALKNRNKICLFFTNLLVTFYRGRNVVKHGILNAALSNLSTEPDYALKTVQLVKMLPILSRNTGGTYFYI